MKGFQEGCFCFQIQILLKMSIKMLSYSIRNLNKRTFGQNEEKGYDINEYKLN